MNPRFLAFCEATGRNPLAPRTSADRAEFMAWISEAKKFAAEHGLGVDRPRPVHRGVSPPRWQEQGRLRSCAPRPPPSKRRLSLPPAAS
jgi:hypothetical protein